MAACILRFNEGRDPERLDMKYEAMRQSPFAFFRGKCHLFWEDWPRDSPLNSAPVIWVCGDLHFENSALTRATTGSCTSTSTTSTKPCLPLARSM